MPFDHFVLVDYENSPDVDLGLIAGKPVHVTLLIGKNQTRLQTNMSIQLHTFAAQVRPIALGESGHNALDLTLAYYLGQATQQWPTATFHVVSKDKDFDPMIRHLVRVGIQVERSDTFRHLPFLQPVKPTPRSVSAKARASTPAPPSAASEDRRAKLMARLTNPTNRNRPATEKALQAHLATALGKDSSASAVQELIAELRQQKALAVKPGGKLVWAAAE